MAISPDDLGLVDIEDSLRRAKSHIEKLREAKRMIDKRVGHMAESELRRRKAKRHEQVMARNEANEETLVTHTPELGQEAHIGPRNNILSGEVLEIGVLTARSVCKITRMINGTGFLVGDGIVLTNYHVIATPQEAKNASFEFLFEDNTIGTARNSEFYGADPDRFFLADEALDICFVAIKGGQNAMPIANLGWVPLIRREGKILIGDPVNIIQHPKGNQQRVVLHESTFLYVDNDIEDHAFCWYSGDTAKGSSGAPVFNAHWELVAIHHKAVPATDVNGNVLDVNGKTITQSRLDQQETTINWIANEGIRVSRIVQHLALSEFPDAVDSDAFDKVRHTLLALWSGPLATRDARIASLNGVETGAT